MLNIFCWNLLIADIFLYIRGFKIKLEYDIQIIV